MSGRIRELWLRLVAPLRRPALDEELREELASHVAFAIDDRVRQGLSPAEARRQALMALGGVAASAERHRDASGVRALEDGVRDVRHALGGLRRWPAFSAASILILALGFGANTGVFSLVSAVLLRPLPFAEPDRLVLLYEDFSASGGPARVEPSPASYAAWNAQGQSFEGIAALEPATYNLTGSGDPERLTGLRTTANLFPLLGMRALHGRTLLPSDEDAAATPVAVVGDSLWRTRFGGDPALVGRSLVLNGLSHTIVGVVAEDFQFPTTDAVVWVPAAFTPSELERREAFYLTVIARLKTDATLGQARAEMRALAERLRPGATRASASVIPLHEQLTSTSRTALYILVGAVALVLLITCANIANLLLARTATRSKELAVRKALGAGRGRVARQLLTESLVLAACGLLAGVFFALPLFEYLGRLMPGTFPSSTVPGLDWRALAVTGAVSLVTVLLFGTGPALIGASRDPADSLRQGTGHGMGTSSRQRFRRGLVVAEVTLTVMLLVGAGLLMRSYLRVLDVDLGFDPDRLLVAETTLSPTKYADGAGRIAFYERVLEQARSIPGVVSAGYANYPPLLFKGGRARVTIEGRPAPPPEDVSRYVVSDRVVSAGYFEALGVSMVRGQGFDSRADRAVDPVVIVNKRMADLHWPGEDPIGRRFRFGSSQWLTIIGVVGDVRQMGLEVPAEPEFYLPLGLVVPVSGPFFWPKYLVLQTAGDPAAVSGAVRRAVWNVDPQQPVASLRPMRDVVAAELRDRNTQLTLIAGFAFLALVLASVGLYGVLSYTVERQTPEIGLRIALGARRADVVRGIGVHAAWLVGLGLLMGLAGAAALGRVLASLLFGVTPVDPGTFAFVAALLFLVGLLATIVPAWRAATVNPVTALRTD